MHPLRVHDDPPTQPAIPIDADQAQVRAYVSLAKAAGRAVAAGDERIDHDRPPCQLPRRCSPDQFMSEDERETSPGMGAFDDVHVRPTQAHEIDVDGDCVAGRLRRRSLFHDEAVDAGEDESRPVHRRTRAPAPAMSASTSACVAIDVSPGVVIAGAVRGSVFDGDLRRMAGEPAVDEARCE